MATKYLKDLTLTSPNLLWVDSESLSINSRSFSGLASGLEDLDNSVKEVWLTENASLTGNLAAGTYTGIDLVIRKGITLTLDGITTINFNIRIEDGGQLAIDEDVTVTGNLESKGNTSGVIAFNTASGKTLTISSPANIQASPIQQIFDGDGTVSFSNTSDNLSIEWHTKNTTPGTTDMSTALIWAIENSRGNTITLPEQIIGISQIIDIYGNTKIKGVGRSIIQAIDTIEGPMIRALQANYVQNDSYFGVSDVKLDGNSNAQIGFQANHVSMANYEMLNRVYVTGCTGDGIHLYNCQGGAIRNIRADGNSGNGVFLDGCNSLRLFSITARQNGENGLSLDSVDGYNGGNYVFGATLENNDGGGLYVGTTVMSYASGLWIEVNESHGVEVDGGKLTLTGAFITGSVKNGSIRAMKLTSGGPFYASGVEITYTGSPPAVADDYLGIGGYDYPGTGIEDAVGNSIIGPNYNRVAGATIEKTLAEVLGDNAVSNGDAETGDTTDWSVVNAGTSISADSGTKYAGSYSFKVETTNNYSWLTQTNIPIIEGILYKISMKAYIPSSGGVSRINTRLIYGGDDVIVDDSDGRPTDEWFDVDSIYFIGKSAATAELRIGNAITENGDFYVDNIKVQPVLRPAQRAHIFRNMVPVYTDDDISAPIN